MQTRRTLIMGVLAATTLTACAKSQYVWHNGAHQAPFTTWDGAATNIQAAVDAAAPGATVWVRKGFYRGVGGAAVVTITKSLTLQGDPGDPAEAVIDGQGSRRGILATLTNENVAVTLRGITVTNGYTSGLQAHGAGIYLNHAAIVSGTATISSCVLAGNVNAGSYGNNSGGGLAARGSPGSAFHAVVSNSVLSGNIVTNRSSAGGGAAFMNTRLTMDNCRIENNRANGAPFKNQAGYGGGVDCANVPSGSAIRSSIFQGNVSKASGNGGGGGLRVSGEATDLVVEDCLFEDNECAYGAAVMQPDGTLTLRNCRIADNHGRRAFYQGWGNSTPTTRIIDCTIIGGKRAIFRAKKGNLMIIDNSWRGSKRDPAMILGEDGTARPVQTIADWEKQRADILRRIELVTGPLPDRSHFPAPELNVLQDDVVEGNLRRQLIEYYTDSRENPRVKAWLFSPTPASCLESDPTTGNTRAAVLCLHQTNREIGKNEPAGLGGDTNMFYALELARRGFVTLAPDFTGYGEYPAVSEFPNDYASATMKGVVDHIRAVDILSGLPCVDPGRIGCIGHSLGGINTMCVSVFEPRIRTIVSSCGYVTWKAYAEVAGDLKAWANPRAYMPRIASEYRNDPDRMPFDLHELVATCAPRPLFVNAPLRDPICPVDGVRETLSAARPIYELYGDANALQSSHPNCGHGFPRAVREQAYRFLERYLGVRNGKGSNTNESS